MWFMFGYSFAGFLTFAFVVWMLVYCIQNDPDRYVWMWVILLFGPLGAGIYFLARFLPTRSFRSSRILGRLIRGRELKQLEWKSRQIGNAHQWVEYGDALRDIGSWDRAHEAYGEAVSRDGDSLPARWGAANTAFHREQYEAAREHLEVILTHDARYKFGDPSLLLGKTLIELGDVDAAQQVLADHVQAHRTPEAVFLLGKLQAEAGDTDTARQTLIGLIDDLEQAPRAIVRKSMFWRSRAKRLIAKL